MLLQEGLDGGNLQKRVLKLYCNTLNIKQNINCLYQRKEGAEKQGTLKPHQTTPWFQESLHKSTQIGAYHSTVGTDHHFLIIPPQQIHSCRVLVFVNNAPLNLFGYLGKATYSKNASTQNPCVETSDKIWPNCPPKTWLQFTVNGRDDLYNLGFPCRNCRAMGPQNQFCKLKTQDQMTCLELGSQSCMQVQLSLSF